MTGHPTTAAPRTNCPTMAGATVYTVALLAGTALLLVGRDTLTAIELPLTLLAGARLLLTADTATLRGLLRLWMGMGSSSNGDAG